MAVKKNNGKVKPPKATLITMSSKEFIKSFVPKEKNEIMKKFQVVVISENIKTKGKYKNLSPAKSLLPPHTLVHEFVERGKTDAYKKGYYKHLDSPEIKRFLVAIIKMLFMEYNVVLLCSEAEKKLGYLKLISKFLESTFSVKAFSYKEYLKSKPKSIKKYKKTVDALYDAKHDIEERGDPSLYNYKTGSEKIAKQLNQMDKSDLILIARQRGIKTKGLGKSQLISQIISRLT